MPDTPNLSLPLIAAAQAQKHVTHNEALAAIDALLHCAVLDKDLGVPPSAPPEGSRYIIAAAASGGWAGQAGRIASWQDGGWTFYRPQSGFIAFVVDEGQIYIYGSSGWVPLATALGAIQNLALLGLGTSADAANPFSAKLNKALWTARNTAEGGTGDLRYTLSKEAAGKTVSLLFQDAYSGRAEIGLVGDDDLAIRMSADGSSFATALKARRVDGKVGFPQGLLHDASGKALSGLIFTPGGDGQVSIYRNDNARAQHPRSAAVSAVTGDVITLSTADAPLFFHAFMTGVCYLRVWNVSKVPAQPAWVKASPSTTTLQMLNAGAIAGWLPGETVQVGDPADVTPGRVIALDVSPMLQSVLGAVFRQSGLLCKASVAGVGGVLALSSSGVAGSFVSLNASDSGAALGGMIVVPCTQPSPVSNSNLVFLRESIGAPNQLGVTIISTIGVFG